LQKYTRRKCKKYMFQFGIIRTSEFLYVTTNHTTDAIKAIVHTVKFRKLKSNVRNTNKTRELMQEVLELSSMCNCAFTQESIKDSARAIILLRLTTDGHHASHGLSATAEQLV